MERFFGGGGMQYITFPAPLRRRKILGKSVVDTHHLRPGIPPPLLLFFLCCYVLIGMIRRKVCFIVVLSA
jgi:hypothetical protein